MRLTRMGMLVVALLILVGTANAGVVVTKEGKVSVGPLVKKGKSLCVKLKYGMLCYKLEKLLWFNDDKRVTDRLIAGKVAYRKEKNERVARILLKSAIEHEPQNREKAIMELKRIDEIKKKKKEEAENALL